MYEEINIEKLREDLINYYGTAIYNSSSLALMDLIKVKTVNENELIEIAIKNKIDLNKYKKYTYTLKR